MIRYGLAIGMAVAALGLRIALEPLLPERGPLQLFVLAVVITSWLGGFGPGLVCTVLSVLLGRAYLLQKFSLSALPVDEISRLIIFTLNGVAISAIAQSMRNAIERQRVAADALRQAATEHEQTTAALTLREHRSAVLARISHQLINTPDPRAQLGEILDQLASELQVELYLQFLATPDGYGLELAHSQGFTPPEIDLLARFASNNSLCSLAVQSREPLVVNDVATCTLPQAEGVRSLGVRVYAGHPLLVAGRLIGVLTFLSRKRPPFQEDELTFLRTVADQIAVVLERTQLFEESSASQRRLESALAAGEMGSWDLDRLSRKLQSSEGCKTVFGRAASEPFSFEDFAAAVHPADREIWRETMATAFAQGTDFSLEYRAQSPDGALRHLVIRGSAQRDARGVVTGLAGICMNVTEQRRVEKLIAEGEARWRELAEAMPQLVWTCTPDGQCDFLSQQWVTYTGQPAEEHLGRRWLSAIHPDDRETLRTAWAQATEAGRFLDTEYRLRRHDGVFRWFKVRGTAGRNEQGQITKWYGSNTDIEDLKIAGSIVHEREQQLRLITDHAPVFLAQVDLAHRYRFVNRPYAARFGRAPEELLGLHISEIVGTPAYEATRSHIEAACAGRHVEFEIEIPYHQIGPRWMHLIFVPDRDGEGAVTGFLTVLTDVTLRKRSEIELAQARDEALDASQAKDAFLSTLSHELRTPLNPVLLIASDALQNPALSPEVRADFETILKNVSLEARLIDDLLDITRISHGKVSLDLQAIEVHGLLRLSSEFIRAELEARQLQLRFELTAVPSAVQGDSLRLQQIFWNLLRNAVKFTPTGGEIIVRTRVAPDQAMLVIDVVDSGIGMNEGEISRIFRSFAQGDHAAGGKSLNYGGLGLGLSICKLLAELHQGRISAASAGQDRGSTFTVELPLASSPASTETPAPGTRETPAPRGSLAILLVEDHDSTRQALAKLLERRGFHVTAAASGSDALELAREKPFDLVISDLGLPDLDGYALMSELRNAHGLRGIALSGYGAAEDVARSVQCGYVKHLTKPVDMALLLAALEEIGPAARP